MWMLTGLLMRKLKCNLAIFWLFHPHFLLTPQMNDINELLFPWLMMCVLVSMSYSLLGRRQWYTWIILSRGVLQTLLPSLKSWNHVVVLRTGEEDGIASLDTQNFHDHLLVCAHSVPEWKLMVKNLDVEPTH